MYELSAGLPFHWIRNGLLHNYPTLEHDLRCEVLIVGSGITGALCAHACAVAGLEVTVVDARAVGTGSTAASTALLQYELDVPLHQLQEGRGEAIAARVMHVGIEAVDALLTLGRQLDVPTITARPSLQFASRRKDERGLQKEYSFRKAHGVRVALLTRSETRQLFPSIDAAALLSEDAAEMDPYAFSHVLLQQVIAAGGLVFDRTEMIHFEREPSGTFLVRTRTGRRITADHLVLATGYESQQYLPRKVMQLSSTYALASERVPQPELWHRDSLIWETAMPYRYMRTTPDRRVIVGGADEPFRDPPRRDALLDRKTKALTRAFRDLMPFVPFEPEYAWCGTFGSSQDGLPYFDRDPKHGAWFVLGMGGNGITLSHAGARIVCAAILGRPDPDARLFRFDR